MSETATPTAQDLVAQGGGVLATPGDTAWMDELVKGKEFLCRVSLMNGSSGLVTEGKANIGEYVYIVSDDDFTPLGREVDIKIIAGRPKALDMSSKTPISWHVQESKEFKEVAAKAAAKVEDFLFGPEFLIWIPKIKKFATFFLSSWSAKKEAKAYNALVGQSATMKTAMAENADGKKYWNPKIVPLSLALSAEPTEEEFVKWLNEFKNPPAPKVTVDVNAQADTR